MKLPFPRLHVDASAVAGLIEWYCNRLGMSRLHWVGYQPSAVVEFRSSQSTYTTKVLQTATIV